MPFRVAKEEHVSKTFRMLKDLLDILGKICVAKNISLNKLVIMCIRYALDNMEESE